MESAPPRLSVSAMATNPSIRTPRRRPNGSANPVGRSRRPRTATRTLVAGTVVAVIVAGILIGVSVAGSESSSSSRPLAGDAVTSFLLSGIPQHGTVLGNPSAPVKLIEYGDLQCPICRAFAVDTLPTIIRQYVRSGAVQIEFRGLAFIGPDSEKALRAVDAAAAQNRAWNLLDLLYVNQGGENSGWVTDSLIRSAAVHIDGLDVAKLLSARSSAATDARMRTAAAQARHDMGGRLRTPTFEVGKAGQPLQLLQITSLNVSQFTPALDRLLGR